MITKSTIIIASNIQLQLEKLKEQLPQHSVRVIQNEDEKSDDFLKDHAKEAIREAYITSDGLKYIILVASRFSDISQNLLLKVLEEPPRNVIFILLTKSKSSILPTIFSRLPFIRIDNKVAPDECEIDLKNLDLRQMHKFLSNNGKITKLDAKSFIQSLMYKAKIQKISFNQAQLDSFSKSIKLIELNSRPINVLSSLLLNLEFKK